MMKALIIILLVVFELSLGFSQNRETDSLKHELSISKTDTHRVMLLKQISGYLGAVNIDSGIYYAQQSLALSREIAFAEGEVEALGMLAWHLRGYGNNSKALELYLKQLKIADKNHFFRQKGNALFVMGMIYRDEFKDADKGLKFLYKARDIADSMQDFKGLTQVEAIIGYTYIKIKQLDSADYYLHLAERHNIQYNINFDGVIYRFLGHFYKEKGDTRKAINYYNQSLKASDVYRDNSENSVTNWSLGIIYQELNQLDSAIYFTTTALNEAQKVNSYKNIIRSATLLHDIYKRNNPIKALEYLEIASAAKDSVQEKNNSTALKSVLDIDVQERQYEIDSAKKEYRNNIRQYGLLAGLVVFSFIGLILYRNNRQKQKANNLLQEQKEKVENTLTQLKSTQAQLIQSEKLASLGELTAGIAHEIQNPLNFVNNFSEMSVELAQELKDEIKKPEKDWELIEDLAEDLSQNQAKINHHGKRASSIVSGMLEHSRTSTGERALTDINKLADEYLRLSYHGLRAKDSLFNADYELIADDNLPKIEVIPQDIGRVLLNLINNAFWACTEQGRSAVASATSLSHQSHRSHYSPKVTVSTRWLSVAEAKSEVEIRITDNGIGMTDDVKAKIFQPFFTTKPTGQGTGLGLSLAYDIVTKGHGGMIEVESVEGEGTTFTVKLPINA